MTSKRSHNEPRLLHSVKQMSINGWGEFQVHPIQLVLSVGTICSDMTSQVQQTAIRKAAWLILASENSVDRYLMIVAISVCNKMHFDFGVN